MNRLELEDLEDRISKETSTQDLATMMKHLERSISTVRSFLTMPPSSFEENKEEINLQIAFSKILMRHVAARLDRVERSVNNISLSYGVLNMEIQGMSDEVQE